MADDDRKRSKTAGTFDLDRHGPDHDRHGRRGKQGHQYPEGIYETDWQRLEPLITPALVIERFLFGIPLISRFKNPETGKPYKMTTSMIQDYIEVGVSEAEEECGIIIEPSRFVQKMPYQREDWMAFGYMQLDHRPISSIEKFSVTFSTGESCFNIPLDWIETANLIHGQLSIIPLAQFSTFDGTGIIGGGGDGNGGGFNNHGSSTFFNSLYCRPWIAALFSVEYTAGFCDGLLPKYVNELIGVIVALRVLGMILGTWFFSSTALSIDGMSQSVSINPRFLQLRMEQLVAQRNLVVRKIKKMYSTKLVASTV